MDVLTGSDTYNMTGTIKYAGGCFAPSIAYRDGMRKYKGSSNATYSDA